LRLWRDLFHRHSGASRSDEPGISRRKLIEIPGLRLSAHPGMTTMFVAHACKHESHANPEVLDRLRLSRAQG